MSNTKPSLRVDKWLWFARFFKTRGLATKVVTGGHVRVNTNRISKASYGVSPGDTLTFPQGDRIRVIEIAELGVRRGPAPEAQTLYRDLTPPPPPKVEAPPRVGARPTKKERRDAAKLKGFDLE